MFYTHNQPTANLGTGRSASERAELRHSTRETVRAWCSRAISCALLAVGRQVAVGEVVEGQVLVAGGPGAFENRGREARKRTHVDLVGS